MNKNLTKIVGITLGLSMAVGVGAGIATSNRGVTRLVAESSSITLIPNNANTGNESTTYVTSHFGFNYGGVHWSFNQWNPNSLQIKTNQTSAISEFNFFTGVFPGSVTEVVITFSALTVSNDNGFMLAHKETAYTAPQNSGGDAMTWDSADKTLTWSNPSSTDKAIAFYQNGKVASGTNYITNVKVTYTLPTDPVLGITGPDYLIDGNAGTITGTITNDDDYTITWSANDANVSFDPDTSSSGEEVEVTFNGVATGTSPIIITGTLDDGSDTAGTKRIYALEHSGTQADPFSATDAQVFSHTDYAAQSGGDWYVQGYVVGTYQTNKGYYIDEDDDATAPYKFEVYNSSGVVNNTGKEIIVGKSYIVAHGAMTYFVSGSQCETTGSIITSVDNGAIPTVIIEGGNRTVDINDSLTLTATTQNPSDATVTWSSDAPDVATINSSTGVVTLVDIGTANITATIVVSGDSYTNTIVLTVERCPVEIGKSYIISSTYSEATYYLSGVNASSLGTCSTDSEDAMVLTVVSGNQPGSFALKNGLNYLKAINDNKLQTETSVTDASSWKITNDGSKDVIANIEQSNRILSYNHNGDTGDCSKNRFAAYKSQQSAAVSISEVVAPEVSAVTVAGDATANANNELSIVKTFLYDVTYVDPNNAGTSAVTVEVLNSSDGTEGASITATPSNGEFSVTFTANDTFTVTVTSAENSLISDSTTITVSNIYVYVPTLSDYEKYDGTLVDAEKELVNGDYIITYDNSAVKSVIDSERASYASVSPENDIISTEDGSIVWRITKSGNYFTIYNASVGKYLASTGAKNKAQLLEDGTDDKAKWSVDISDAGFEFINKKNDDAGVNAHLRKNGTYGFACYATGTGGQLTLYKKNAKFEIENHSTTISALKFNYADEITSAGSYFNVSIRFGGFINKAQWIQLNAESTVEGYGILVAANNDLGGQTIKQKYAAAKNGGNTPLEAINSICSDHSILKNIPSKTTPAAANEDQKTFMGVTDDHYIWTVKKDINTAFATKFNAVAFILIDGDIVFLQEVSLSGKDIADAALDRTDPSDPARPALQFMKENF